MVTLARLRGILTADAFLQSKLGGAGDACRVHAFHKQAIANPVYPLVTLSQINAVGDSGIRNLEDVYVAVDVWSRNSVTELHTIYRSREASTNRIVGIWPLLHLPTPQHRYVFPDVRFEYLRELDVVDLPFEEITKVYHLAARYLIRAVEVSPTLVG